MNLYIFIIGKIVKLFVVDSVFCSEKLEENEVATKKFELAAAKKAYQSTCQIFHLKSLH